jgi:hypothetical protein
MRAWLVETPVMFGGCSVSSPGAVPVGVPSCRAIATCSRFFVRRVLSRAIS